MQLIPKKRADWIRVVLFLGLFAGVIGFLRLDRVVAFYLSEKSHGDMIFQSLPRGELVDAIEGVSQSEWSHCGILVRREGKWMVAESIGQVRYTPLHLWIVRGRKSKIASYRLKSLPADLEKKLEPPIEELLDRLYDFSYAPEDNEIYCSELIYKVYERGTGIKIGEWEKLGTLNWQPHEKFIRGLEGGELPLDRPMITPVGLTRSPLVEKVF
jgi:hypothetical protein